MSKTTYLFYVFLFGMFLGIDRLAVFAQKPVEYTTFIILTCFLIYGFFYWKRGKVNNVLFNRKAKIIVCGFTLLMFVTPLVPLVNYGQSYILTLLSQRGCYVWILLIIMIWMRPSPNEIMKALKYICMISFLLWLLSVVMPDLFIDNAEEFLTKRRQGYTSDIGMKVPGFILSVFFILYVNNLMMKVKGNTRLFLIASMLLLWAIVYQNRSTLLIIGISYAYSLLRSPYIRTPKTILLLLLSIIIFFPFGLKILMNLVEESQNQLDESTYNRWIALDQFLISADYHWYTIMFGHGVVANSGKYMEMIVDIGDKGGYLADIGLIGSFWYYGAFPIWVLISCSIMSFSKRIPSYIKLYSLWLWIVPTQHNYLHPYVSTNLPIIIYVYLVFYYYYVKKRYRVSICILKNVYEKFKESTIV